MAELVHAEMDVPHQSFCVSESFFRFVTIHAFDRRTDTRIAHG